MKLILIHLRMGTSQSPRLLKILAIGLCIVLLYFIFKEVVFPLYKTPSILEPFLTSWDTANSTFIIGGASTGFITSIWLGKDHNFLYFVAQGLQSPAIGNSGWCAVYRINLNIANNFTNTGSAQRILTSGINVPSAYGTGHFTPGGAGARNNDYIFVMNNLMGGLTKMENASTAPNIADNALAQNIKQYFAQNNSIVSWNTTWQSDRERPQQKFIFEKSHFLWAARACCIDDTGATHYLYTVDCEPSTIMTSRTYARIKKIKINDLKNTKYQPNNVAGYTGQIRDAPSGEKNTDVCASATSTQCKESDWSTLADTASSAWNAENDDNVEILTTSGVLPKFIHPTTKAATNILNGSGTNESAFISLKGYWYNNIYYLFFLSSPGTSLGPDGFNTLSFFNTSTKTWSTAKILKNKGVATETSEAVYRDMDIDPVGNLWLLCTHGQLLYVFKMTSTEVKNFINTNDLPENLSRTETFTPFRPRYFQQDLGSLNYQGNYPPKICVTNREEVFITYYNTTNVFMRALNTRLNGTRRNITPLPVDCQTQTTTTSCTATDTTGCGPGVISTTKTITTPAAGDGQACPTDVGTTTTSCRVPVYGTGAPATCFANGNTTDVKCTYASPQQGTFANIVTTGSIYVTLASAQAAADTDSTVSGIVLGDNSAFFRLAKGAFTAGTGTGTTTCWVKNMSCYSCTPVVSSTPNACTSFSSQGCGPGVQYSPITSVTPGSIRAVCPAASAYPAPASRCTINTTGACETTPATGTVIDEVTSCPDFVSNPTSTTTSLLIYPPGRSISSQSNFFYFFSTESAARAFANTNKAVRMHKYNQQFSINRNAYFEFSSGFTGLNLPSGTWVVPIRPLDTDYNDTPLNEPTALGWVYAPLIGSQGATLINTASRDMFSRSCNTKSYDLCTYTEFQGTKPTTALSVNFAGWTLVDAQQKCDQDSACTGVYLNTASTGFYKTTGTVASGSSTMYRRNQCYSTNLGPGTIRNCTILNNACGEARGTLEYKECVKGVRSTANCPAPAANTLCPAPACPTITGAAFEDTRFKTSYGAANSYRQQCVNT